MGLFAWNYMIDAFITHDNYQNSYTAEGAKRFVGCALMDLNMIKENNGKLGFYEFDIAKFEHNLILGDLKVNKSSEKECKILDNWITCQNKCIKVTNFTNVGKRKDIHQDVVAYSPIIFMLSLFTSIVPILISVVYFYWLYPRFGVLGLWLPNFFSILKEKKYYYYCPIMILSLPVNILFGEIFIYLVPLSMIYFQFKPFFQQKKQKVCQLSKFKVCQVNINVVNFISFSTSYLIFSTISSIIGLAYILINFNSNMAKLTVAHSCMVIVLVIILKCCGIVDVVIYQ